MFTDVLFGIGIGFVLFHVAEAIFPTWLDH